MVLSSNNLTSDLVNFDKTKLQQTDIFINDKLNITCDDKISTDPTNTDFIKLTKSSISTKLRCAQCNCKINITNSLECKCEKLFCMKHRYHTEHNCSYDYKTQERKKLSEANKQIIADKIIKI
jgi:hypothetical protein